MIRLMRFGRKNDPRYRVVVVPKRSRPTGKYIENLGTYDPRADSRNLNEERTRWWLDHGAQPSDTVHNVLVGLGVRKGPKRPKHHVSVAKGEAAVQSTPDTKNTPEQTSDAPAPIDG